ncbi:MAG: NgoFVII family restriction endonuclease [Desulfosporosinus sp.]|nr:NgoFVII family restriction endonuclease [Desulfosporosinus sp.]
MASRHIRDIIDQRRDVKISLIVGMCPLDGLDIAVHNGFVELMENDNFECKYVYKSPAVHSKLYIWCQNSNPKEAFIGSANYTQPGFSSSRKEVLASCDPDLAYRYYEEIEPDTIFANHGEVEEYIRLTKKMPYRLPRVSFPTVAVADSTSDYVITDAEKKLHYPYYNVVERLVLVRDLIGDNGLDESLTRHILLFRAQ